MEALAQYTAGSDETLGDTGSSEAWVLELVKVKNSK